MDTHELESISIHPDNIVAVALSPGEMPAEQQRLSQWCKDKIRALNVERSDFLDNAVIAREHGWQHASLTAAARRVENRMTYYEKLAAALDAGYLIVPNFPVEVMAVRVRESHRKPYAESVRGNWSALSDVKADPNVPAGLGRYVDNRPMSDISHPLVEKNGKKEFERVETASAFSDEIDFPVLAVKPRIMNATARAMATKIFDDIGVVTGRHPDPVVIGRIFQPGKHGDAVSFFIAWWVDTKSLEVE